MYSLTICSSNPTEETKYPLAQNRSSLQLHFLLANCRAITISPCPSIQPIIIEAAYLDMERKNYPKMVGDSGSAPRRIKGIIVILCDC